MPRGKTARGRRKDRTIESGGSKNARRAPIQDLLIDGLQHYPSVIAKLPKNERLALIETLKSLPSSTDYFAIAVPYPTTDSNMNMDANVNVNVDVDAKALEMILYNVETSPNLVVTKEQFHDVILEVLQSDLQRLALTTASSSSHRPLLLTNETVDAMREKVISGDWEGLLAQHATHRRLHQNLSKAMIDDSYISSLRDTPPFWRLVCCLFLYPTLAVGMVFLLFTETAVGFMLGWFLPLDLALLALLLFGWFLLFRYLFWRY